MAEILAFVRSDRKPTRSVSGPVNSADVVVFPRASVLVHGVWALAEGNHAITVTDSRADA
jgi:hypothetical protein